jgi:hypothetical protein
MGLICRTIGGRILLSFGHYGSPSLATTALCSHQEAKEEASHGTLSLDKPQKHAPARQPQTPSLGCSRGSNRIVIGATARENARECQGCSFVLDATAQRTATWVQLWKLALLCLEIISVLRGYSYSDMRNVFAC